jgi:hypothetical protein
VESCFKTLTVSRACPYLQTHIQTGFAISGRFRSFAVRPLASNPFLYIRAMFNGDRTLVLLPSGWWIVLAAWTATRYEPREASSSSSHCNCWSDRDSMYAEHWAMVLASVFKGPLLL